MALNIISNFAANVAHRNLTMSDSEATSSVAKLSAGKRVLSAKDDAASLAIGSRLSAEVAGLKQAGVNAGQASSMLQIADGAMDKVNDILTRMKTLAVQSGSGQLSSTERGMLDTEFQSLKNEIDRIAEDTEFNGTKLVGGSVAVDGFTDGGATDATGASQGIHDIAARGVNTATVGTAVDDFSYTAPTGATGLGTFSITVGTGTGAETWTGQIDMDALSGSGTGASLQQAYVVELTNTGAEGTFQVALDSRFDLSADYSDTGTITLSGADEISLDFKVGTGTHQEQDQISVTIGSMSTGSLGVDSLDITNQTSADVASEAISSAIDTLQVARANVGASQNRLDFASANIATSQENQEAARSQLMDLDVAAEMSKFTSKQILVQAGTSMLAQANQLPQNLLSLFR